MKKLMLCVVLVMVSVSSAFGDATDEQMKAGGDVNAVDEFGMTVLMYTALGNINPEVVKALINAGADIFAGDNEGKTALDYANNDKVKSIILDAAK